MRIVEELMEIWPNEVCDNKAIIRTKTGIDFILATCSGLLYVVEIDKIQPTAFTAQSK